jgi:PAS domain S-box-containing protein
MGHLIRGFDWSATPLGDPSTWPVPLRTALRVLLTTNHPIFLFWGPDHICFYNDAYKQSLGPEKHPAMLGAKGREAWDEIWEIIGPQVEQVLAGKGATWHENHLVPITRFGRREEVYWTYSYSPIDDESAETGVGGVLVICTETTAQVRARRAAQEEAQRQRRLFEAAPGFIAILHGPDHVFEFVNAAYARLFGGRDFVGKSVREVFPDVQGQGIFELLDQVYTTGRRFIAEGLEVRLRPGTNTASTKLVLDFIYEPIIDEFGKVGGIFVEGYEVTDRARAEETNARLAAIVSSSPDAIISFAPEDGRISSWNQGAEETFGYSAEEAIGAPVTLLLPREALSPDEDSTGIFNLAMARGSVRLESRRRRKDGAIIDVSITATQMKDEHGKPLGVSAIFRDITAQKRAHERQLLLARELHHRIKNTLATVQAIAGSTARSVNSIHEFMQRFSDRLISMGRTHTLITENDWAGANLRDLLRLELDPYDDGSDNRIKLVGPEVYLPPDTALALGFGFHELTTNAVKHGALSVLGGQVEVTWSTTAGESGDRLQLTWVERSGPPVSTPSRRGFGSQLLQRVLGTQVDGSVNVAYERDGVSVEIELPLKRRTV